MSFSSAVFVVVFVAFAASPVQSIDLPWFSKYATVPDIVLDVMQEKVLRAHTEFLADPLLEGRRAGTRGEGIATRYIAANLKAFGIEPAGEDGSYFQSVPIEYVVPTAPSALSFSNQGGSSAVLAYNKNYVGSTYQRNTDVTLAGDEDVVFAGYGIVNPDLGWNDYKGVNVSGKIVIVLLGQPSVDPWTVGTAFSRWSHKVAVASQLGAKAVIMIVTPESSYEYAQIASQQGGVVIQTATSIPPVTPVSFYAWISLEKAEEIAALVGSTVDAWRAAANDARFSAETIGIRAFLSSVYTFRAATGTNVVGIARGRDAYAHEAVVISAHHDHLGFDAKTGGVYTGAIDNAAGVAIVLAQAQAISWMVSVGIFGRNQRSIVFLFPTAEEMGLLGAAYYIKKTPLGLKIVADVNYDIPNAFGKSLDVAVLGNDLSNVGTQIIPWAAQKENLTAVGDPMPKMGLLARGDSYAFLMNGIPAVWIGAGTSYVGRPPEYMLQFVWGIYMGKTYHTIDDNYPKNKYFEISFDGIIQNARVGLRTAYAIAGTPSFVPAMIGNVAKAY